MELAVHGVTHQGLVRPANEDHFVCGARVLAVGDGLGGHVAGDVASRLALEPVAALDTPEATCAELVSALPDAVRAGNEAVLADATANPARRGMGTTVTAAVVCDGNVHLAHVGDSRAYRLRPGEGLRQLTMDHTPVGEAVRAGLLDPEEAAGHPSGSVLSRAIGLEPDVEIDVLEPVPLEPGDRLLLCSDGLTAVVADAGIARLLADADGPVQACEALVDATLAAGAPDNVTVVVAVAAGG